MEKQTLLYEGKAKRVYATQDPELLIVSYKDDATAFNGAKKGTIQGKGVINNQMSNLLMARLERQGVPTHFVRELGPRETLVKRVSIVPLEVIVRNLAAGSFSKRSGAMLFKSTGCSGRFGRTGVSFWWTSKWSLAVCPMGPSCWRMRSAPIPAACGTPKHGKSWTRTASAGTWAEWKMPTAG